MVAPKVASLITEEQIEKRVGELARQIASDYRGGEIMLICILKGGWVFMADLARKIKAPLICDFLGVASYGAGMRSTGEVKIVSDLSQSVEGRDVLIVEEIMDTGRTLRCVVDILNGRKPNSLKVCVLLDKPARREAEVTVDYVGFTIEDKFIVGYGADYNGQYRELPYIGYIDEA